MAQNISIGTGDNAGDGITIREAFRRIRKNFAEIYGDTDAANLTDTEVLPTGTFAEAVQDIVGAMVTGNTVNNITVTYQDSDGTLDFDVAADITDINVGAGIQGSSLDAGSPTISITTSDLFVDDTNNRVGINTNTPSVTLDVNGDLKVSGELQFTAQGTNNIYLGPSGTGNLSNNTTAARNLAAGSGSMTSLTSGTDNVALGFNAGASITEGDGNVAIGAYSLDAATGASGQSVAVGYQSLTAQTSGTNNTGLGHRAIGSNTDGDNNVAVGDNALYAANSPDKSTAVGSQALDGGNNTSTENTAVGWKSMGATGGGDYNTAVGTESLRNVTGSSNVAIGSQALRSISSGANNVAVGRNAGRYESDGATIINPTQSVYIGSSTESGVTDGTPSNEIVIGYGATGNGDNTVTLGNTSITETILQGSVGIGTTSPASKMHVDFTADFDGLRIQNSTRGHNYLLSTAGGSAEYFNIYDLDNSRNLFTIGDSGATIYTGGNPSITVDSSSNVGIGTTSPSHPLTLHSTGNGIKFEVSDTVDANYRIQVDGDDIKIGSSTASDQIFISGNTERMRITSGGQISATGAGTAAAPSIIVAGDSDTGWYRPAGNTIGFSTAGTERMRIDSSGNSTFYGNTLIDNGVDSTLFIGKGSEGVDGVTKIKSYQSGADTDQLGLQFYVHPSATGSASTELAMTIDHNKNVGIGTTSPNAALEIHGNLNIGDGTSVTSIGLQRNSANYLTATDAAGYLVFRTGGANERMRIDTNGVSTFTSENTTSGQRTSKYDSLIVTSLYSGGDGAPFTGFGGGVVFKNETYNGTNYDSAAIYGGIGDDSVSTNAGGHLAFYTASTKTASPTEKMRIDASGSAGIGITNPNSYSFNGNVNLVAGNTSGNGTITIVSSTTGLGYLAFADATSGIGRYSGVIEYGHTDNYMSFKTASTERLRITSNGEIYASQGTNNQYFGLNSGNVGTATGTTNTGFGGNVLPDLTSGNNNVAMGYAALFELTTASNNTAIGTNTGTNITTGQRNTLMGSFCGRSLTTGSDNTAYGYLALDAATTCSYNVALGYNALADATTGGSNIAIGAFALDAITTSTQNVAIGSYSLGAMTTGNSTTTLGYNTGAAITTAVSNTIVGHKAGESLTAGSSNVLIGARSGDSMTTAGGNVAVGYQALQAATTSGNNTAIGYTALLNATDTNNVALGIYAGRYRNDATDDANPTQGVYLGGLTTTGGANSATNEIVIGYDAEGQGSNKITLGNSSITHLYAQVTSITALSDKRDKKNIEEMSEGLDFVNKLKPVTFEWDTRDGAKKDIKASGFIAQDLLETQNSSDIGDYLDLVDDQNEDKLQARYGNLIPVLVKAIQEQQKEIEYLKSKI